MMMFLIYAFVFYIGALFTEKYGLKFKDMYQSIFGVMFAAFGSGNAAQFAPDRGKAMNAAVNIFKILDEKPEIDPDDAKATCKEPIKGMIEFKNVMFKYPSRDRQIYKGLSFKIDASKKVAFVGPSGCGKSTVISLLMRFYDIQGGQILIDGRDIKEYDINHLRTSFGYVSQEPTLFNGSVEFNIKYCRPDASEQEMKTVAVEARAAGFIEANEFDDIKV
jgi:ATP-binding cassette subfamily B (MDR/TAP) protein 1